MSIEHVLVVLAAPGLHQERLKIRIRQYADPALGRGEEYLGAAEAECYLVSLHALLVRGQRRRLPRREDVDVVSLPAGSHGQPRNKKHKHIR